MADHIHNYYEFCFITEGSGVYEIDGSVFKLMPNSVIVFDSRLSHRLTITDDSTRGCSIILSKKPFPLPDFKYRLFSHAGFYLNMCNKISDMFFKGEQDDLILGGAEFLTELIKNDIAESYSSKIKSYISYNYMNAVDMKTIASVFHLSTEYIQRLFKQDVGSTIGEYVKSTRLYNAEYLLKETDFSIDEISGLVGFGTRQALYHVFINAHGVSPQEYRKQNK